jgi:radical SAM superfamily enzyme YgiQ (UPF0313 family)
MKIMLAIAPWDLWEDQEADIYPNGLASLAVVLEKNNHQVDMLDLTYSSWDNVKGGVEERIKKEMPDILAVSILSNSRISALKLINLARQINPKITVLAGGVHTTCLPEQVINNYPLDFAVIGEGEITLLELLNAIKNKKSIAELRKIKGIIFKHNGEVIKTPPRERIKDLDSLPFPKHELFKNLIEKSNTAQIMSSRGCPFSCTFCPSSVHWGRCMVQRSAKNVFEEIKYLLDKFPNLKHIRFCDDEFICVNQRVIELCKMILKENIKIEWDCLGRASSMNEEVVKWMKKAGCVEIAFGIESGSQRILNNIGKRVTTKQILDSINLCKKYNIRTKCLTIVGLPGENSESVNETIKLFRKMKKATEPAILIVFPGTEVYRLAKEKGLMTDEYWLGEGLCPLYTCEHSKLKLWLWAFKIGFITHLHAEGGYPRDFIKRKFLHKLHPHNFIRIFKRYFSDKT